ncbi:hypothetical protein [Lachnospira eligens]|jgi:hypothetical protein|uniref:hypothetical protein n=1 Tax=Lachnospira eligens TaxID=39485 RepID=UPI000E5CE47A|nr:hypothetical protein [Lachnospira eligens]RGZ70226.1 hypothetical protein DW976_10185 [Lachnospira eligens]DAV85790.1 MAG TPA: hypothetical protein [Caudoviricetes sp.]
MPKVDLTVTISVIIAICAIISPIITTLLNNHHICKMRKLDDAAQLQKDSYFYKRGIYEDYLRCTCRCITAASPAALNDYGKAYALALIYFPNELQDKIIALNNDIKHYLWGEASSKLNELAPLIREQLQKM